MNIWNPFIPDIDILLWEGTIVAILVLTVFNTALNFYRLWRTRK